MTLTGRASIFGINGATTWTAAVALAAGDQLLQSSQLTDDFDLAELKDQAGEPIGLAKTNHRQNMTIDLVPVGSTAAPTSLAAAKVALQLPPPLAAVTLSGFDKPVAAAGFYDMNGEWVYIGNGTIGLTNDGYAKMTLPLRRYENTALTTAIGA